MEENEIKILQIGDVLINKNINKKVTVEDITINNKIVCVWHDDDAKPYRELLLPEELEKQN